ncbi:hypothetical protein AVEN_271499-1 [Araneus ventricosus]|uniref:Uncharacterized protein n=1 Tax=Araneus ventricosus TaxID=182803 RepID=A0A4Y2IE84_ARAVE|nr:hypothetical protein AVEN_271499-1 [Araneus ventricosus]
MNPTLKLTLRFLPGTLNTTTGSSLLIPENTQNSLEREDFTSNSLNLLSEFISVKQCKICFGYGHTSRNCDHTQNPRCGKTKKATIVENLTVSIVWNPTPDSKLIFEPSTAALTEG